MQKYFLLISVDDPYPKTFKATAEGSTIEVAMKRGLARWRKTHWKRRPLKNGIRVYAKKI